MEDSEMKADISKTLKGVKALDVFKVITRGAGRKAGQSPGTLIHVGDKKVEDVRISVIDYDVSRCDEKDIAAPEECFPYRGSNTVTWINISGLHDPNIISAIGSHFGIHPLVLEDILHTGQRPKIEDFEGYLFTVLNRLTYNQESREVQSEQVSLILGNNFVISFQESSNDVFNPVRERIRKAGKRIRTHGPDYLLYALVDVVVDGYFVVMEKIGEKIEALEEILIQDPPPEALQSIHRLHGEAIFLRKTVWPLRDVIHDLENGEPELVTDAVTIYFRDVHDHIIQAVEAIESCRDLVAGMHSMYSSAVGNRMNKIMSVLTIIATIFIPLTFIAGIYGMNFEYMPELRWWWSYPVLLILLALTGISMFAYFKKKKWF